MRKIGKGTVEGEKRGGEKRKEKMRRGRGKKMKGRMGTSGGKEMGKESGEK